MVFPDAPVKLYLQARSGACAPRAEPPSAPASRARVGAALDERDRRDARTVPHTPAEGATVIDTSDLTPEQVLAAALAVVRRQAPELAP